MEHGGQIWNKSLESQAGRTTNSNRPLVSDSERQVVTVVTSVILSGVISLFGIITNVINMVIFYRQGLTTTINISFFAMAVSDLCGLLVQQLFNVYINPLCEELDWPIVYTELQHMTSGIPREMFARITCLITVYITAERCLCIAFPLHVKLMTTPRRTTIAIALMFIFPFAYAAPFYATSYLGWKNDPPRNRTLLMIMVKDNHDVSEAVLYFIHSFTGFLAFLAVVVFTSILIRKLGQKSAWRETASAHQDKSMCKKDRSTMSMVALIASILILCYTPSVLLAVTTFLEPSFNFAGRYFNLYYMLWAFALLFENLNSSVNIFLYFKMSSKFRKNFHQIFQICHHNLEPAGNSLSTKS